MPCLFYEWLIVLMYCIHIGSFGFCFEASRLLIVVHLVCLVFVLSFQLLLSKIVSFDIKKEEGE